MASEVQICALSEDNLSSVSAIHMRAFPRRALTALGVDAVRRYYAWQLSGPHEVVAIGANCDDTLMGFCFGGVFRGALSGFIRANRGFLIRRVLTRPWLVANSSVRHGLHLGLRTLQMFSTKSRITSVPQLKQRERSFGILAIAVDPAFQGTDIGKILFQESELQAARQGFTRMHLTVHRDNVQAIRFYEGMGWQKSSNTDSWNGYMSKTLSNS